MGWCGAQVEPDEGYSTGNAIGEVTTLERNKAKLSSEDVCVSVYDRDKPDVGMWNILGCYRSQWSHSVTPSAQGKKVLFDEVIKNRRCRYYAGYDASHNPEQHLQIQKMSRERRNQVLNIVIGALAVAGATALVRLIEWLFTK